MNNIYRGAYEAKPVESSFSFDDEALKIALKRIYEKDVDVMNDIEENIFNAVFETMSGAVDEGFGVPEGTDPDAAFYKALKEDTAVFAAFKTHRWQNDIAGQLLDEKGRLKPYEQFRRDVDDMVNPQHKEQWLRTEYDMAISRARQAADWQQFIQEKDILPNLEWVESTSITPGQDHMIFWGMIAAIDDPCWNEHRPGDRWGCKCGLRSTDEPCTEKPDVPVAAKENDPAPGLKGNPGVTGELFSKDHPYMTDTYKGAEKAVNTLLTALKKEQEINIKKQKGNGTGSTKKGK